MGPLSLEKTINMAFFPSGSIAWKLHEEDFIKKLGWFYTLKTRLSYGTIGNQDIFPYASLATVGAVGQGTFNNGGPISGKSRCATQSRAEMGTH